MRYLSLIKRTRISWPKIIFIGAKRNALISGTSNATYVALTKPHFYNFLNRLHHRRRRGGVPRQGGGEHRHRAGGDL